MIFQPFSQKRKKFKLLSLSFRVLFEFLSHESTLNILKVLGFSELARSKQMSWDDNIWVWLVSRKLIVCDLQPSAPQPEPESETTAGVSPAENGSRRKAVQEEATLARSFILSSYCSHTACNKIRGTLMMGEKSKCGETTKVWDFEESASPLMTQAGQADTWRRFLHTHNVKRDRKHSCFKNSWQLYFKGWS